MYVCIHCVIFTAPEKFHIRESAESRRRDNLQQNRLDAKRIVFQLIHAFRPHSKKDLRLSHLFLNKRAIYIVHFRKKTTHLH